MKTPPSIINSRFDDAERLRKLESELKAMKKLINLILQNMEDGN